MLGKVIHVALIVGQQHKSLEIARIGAGIVRQALQCQVDAGCVEQGQRKRMARTRAIRAVGDTVVDIGQIGQIERPLHGPQIGRLQIRRGRFDDKRQGNWLAAQAHMHGSAVVVDEQRELFQQIVMKQIGPGHVGPVHPALAQRAIGRPGIGRQPVRGDFDADIRIEGIRHGLWLVLAGHETTMTRPYALTGALIQHFDMRQSRLGRFEGLKL